VDDGFPEGDDDIMEEDLMDDKISSSPSIDEGEFFLRNSMGRDGCGTLRL